ncbi:hypothetical protein BASA60_002277 [Batrachochytrium salamandrivorans]|nr:hypothetical protein BASA60_002277 [Batrachochytrium salamandrivorans]
MNAPYNSTAALSDEGSSPTVKHPQHDVVVGGVLDSHDFVRGGRRFQKTRRDLAKEIHASLYCGNSEYQRAALNAHYSRDACFDNPLVSVIGVPAILAQFRIFTWLPHLHVAVSSVYETISSRPGRSTTTDAVVIDAWVTITIVPGFIKFPVRIISMVEFNEHDRICSHEDVWSARDMLATLPAGLGWVYDAVRTLNGALSSVWIEAVVGLGKSFRSIPKGVGPFPNTRHTGSRIPIDLFDQDRGSTRLKDIHRHNKSCCCKKDPSYAAMSAEVDADGDVTAAIAVPVVAGAAAPSATANPGNSHCTDNINPLADTDAHMNQALHASSSKTSGSPPRSVALHSPAPSDIDSVSSSASHRLPTTTPTSSSSSPLRHSSPATSSLSPIGSHISTSVDGGTPPVDEIKTMLELLMEDLNLTEDKKDVLRRLPDDRKWMMLLQHLGERYRTGPQEVLHEIQEIQKLKDGADRELLTNLVVSLRSRPIRWISGFIDHGGFAVLLDNLNELEMAKIHNEFEELYIKCLKSLMNNKIGLSAVLDTDEALNVIALSLRSPSPRTRALVLEIFGAVCLIPGGHSCVLHAMDALSDEANTRFRFEIVVYSLWQSCRAMTPLDKELQVASMSFINAVICGGPGVDLEFRMHMRSEFIQLGLLQLIEKIAHLENDLLQTQIDVFIRANETDELEWFDRIGHEPFNKDNIDELSKRIVETTKVSSSQAQYSSILNHISLLPANPIERLRYMMIIDKVIQQIVLQRDGEDPDPVAALANLDMRHLVGDMTSTEILKDQEEKYQKQLEKSKRLEKEITNLNRGEPIGDEMKMRIMNAQRQIKDMEIVMKEKLSTVAGGDALLEMFKEVVQSIANVKVEIVPAESSTGSAPPPPPPPPPPGSGFGGPPPPPPPPPGSGFGMSNSAHPPAFGAYAASAGPKAKATNLSSKPLKSFNWTKLPPMKVKETIWANIDDEEIHKRLRGDVYSTFEDMFAAREIKSMDSASASKEDISVKEITFLDGKRSQNCNIMLKAVKLDPKLIKRAILTVDTDTLPRFVLAELLKFIPTDDEITALKQYTAADLPTLASAERFMFEISEIENYEPKLKAMHFKTCFGEYEDDAETLITGLQKASEDVMNSKKFTDLLKVILALGNYLNSGARGGAYGFKIGSLLKMMDTKSTVQGRKHTLLHYLTELVDQSFPNIQGFEKDLIHVEEGSKVTIAQIRQCLIMIRDNLKVLEDLLKIMEKENVKEKVKEKQVVERKKSNASMLSTASSATSEKLNVKLETIMATFHAKATKIYTNLDERFKIAEAGFEKAVNLYGEDPKNATPEEFFGTFSKFTLAFLAAKADNETAVAKERELKKREEAKKATEDRRRKKKEDVGGKSSMAEKDGGLDDLISAIRTGKAFGGGSDPNPAPAPRQRRAHPREGTRGADGSRDGSSTSDGHGLEGLQTQLQRNVMRETSNSHLRDKSFQNAEQGAVGRLRRQGSFKDRASLQQRDTGASAPGNPTLLAKQALNKDPIALLSKTPAKEASPSTPQKELKPVGIAKENSRDIMTRLESAVGAIKK